MIDADEGLVGDSSTMEALQNTDAPISEKKDIWKLLRDFSPREDCQIADEQARDEAEMPERFEELRSTVRQVSHASPDMPNRDFEKSELQRVLRRMKADWPTNIDGITDQMFRYMNGISVDIGSTQTNDINIHQLREWDDVRRRCKPAKTQKRGNK